MARFCRHNRFIERCPICRETVPGLAPSAPGGGSGAGKPATKRKRAGGTRTGPNSVRVYRAGPERGEDDGYGCELVPGLRGSGDAERLAREIAFASARLGALSASPPGLYAQARAEEDEEQATWICFLIAYLSPLQADDPSAEAGDPFAGIRTALAADWRRGELPDLDAVPLGPRASHERPRGTSTLRAYLQWVGRAGSQGRAFRGDGDWSASRRFERLFERLTLPGLARVGRYELLITLGRLGLYELRADSLHLSGAAADPTMLAAKRVFGIGDPLILDRRALALAEELPIPIEALDLALANWGTGERATLGFPDDVDDSQVLARVRRALDL